MDVNVNTLIEYKDNELKTQAIERILWISREEDEVILINIDKTSPHNPRIKSYAELVKELTTPYVLILVDDPFKELISPNEDYLRKYKRIRDEKWNIIKTHIEFEPNIYHKETLKEIVSEIKKNSGKGSKRIYSILREYWIGGKKINALLPNYLNSGGRGKPKIPKDKKLGRPSKVFMETGICGVNVTAKDKEIFELAISLFFKGKNNNLKNAYEEMIPKFYISGYKKINEEVIPIALPDDQIPNYRQFLRWYNANHNFKERTINQKGERKYNLQYRPIIGDATNKASGPGDIYEIDATIGDIYLVSDIDRTRIIGRPVIYIVKDVYSRMVVGVYVGLEGPSWLAAMMAFENTTISKKEYCKKMDIEIEDEDWPSKHLPKRLKADRGEFESANADNLVESLGIQIINTPPYRADLKGIVERHFRILNDRFKQHWMPGVVHKDFKERGGRDYRLDAKLTLKAFERIIVLTILEHNKSIINGYNLEKEMIEAKLLPTPINIWNWGIKHRSGLLRVVDKDLIRLNLMPSSTATVTGEGIIHNKLRYTSMFAIENAWFEKARNRRWKEIVYYDPRDVQHIYLKISGNNFVKCFLVKADERYAQFRLEEVQEQHFVNDIKVKLESTSLRQIKIDTNFLIKNTIEIETKKTNEKSNNESKTKKIKGIKENRKIEKIERRKEEHWGNTLEEEEVTFNSKVVELRNIQNKETEEENEHDYLLNLIIQQSMEGDN